MFRENFPCLQWSILKGARLFFHYDFRDNLASIKLYYDNLSYEQLEQQPSYDTLAWLGK